MSEALARWRGGTSVTEARALRVAALVIGIGPLLVPAWAAAGGALAVAALIGLSLVPTAGWLRRPTLYHGAAAGLAAHVTGSLLGGGQSIVVALLWSAVVGAGVGLAVALLLRGGVPGALPLAAVSLALSVLAWSVLQARVPPRPFAAPVFLGIDLGTPRARYLLLAGAVLVGGLLLERLRVRAAGRGLVATGADPAFAARTGTAPVTAFVGALCLSGGFAGVAGWGAALAAAGLPVAAQFGPGLTIAYLAVPLLGGTGSSFGVVLGAALLVVPTRLLGADPVVVGGVLLALVGLRR